MAAIAGSPIAGSPIAWNKANLSAYPRTGLTALTFMLEIAPSSFLISSADPFMLDKIAWPFGSLVIQSSGKSVSSITVTSLNPAEFMASKYPVFVEAPATQPT